MRVRKMLPDSLAHKNKRWTDAEDALIQSLRNDNWKLRDIATLVQRTRTSVGDRLKKLRRLHTRGKPEVSSNS